MEEIIKCLDMDKHLVNMVKNYHEIERLKIDIGRYTVLSYQMFFKPGNPKTFLKRFRFIEDDLGYDAYEKEYMEMFIEQELDLYHDKYVKLAKIYQMKKELRKVYDEHQEEVIAAGWRLVAEVWG